jgi:hypothetical protein
MLCTTAGRNGEGMSVGGGEAQVLARAIAGQVILPADPEYEAARHVWNGMIDKRPAVIVRCASADDVAAGIAFGRSAGLVVAVRGGGHNVAGNATCDDGLVLDLSLLKAIEVDPKTRRARAGGGVLWGEFDAATQAYGLATTGGLIPSTGIAGFTLGGGLGHLMRSYGLACDNLVAAEVVTADGGRLQTSADEHADLFWALRGGGGNFGVVTEFEFQLHEVGPTMLAGRLAHPLDRATGAIRFYRDFCAAAPDELMVYAGLATGPDGKPRFSLRAVYNGAITDGARAVQPLRAYGQPLLDDIEPRPYLEVQRMIEPIFPPGRLNYWKANFVDSLSDELIDVLVGAIARAPSPYSMIALEPMGGAIARVDETATAFEHRGSAFSLLILAGWTDAADTEANVSGARALWNLTRPLSSPRVYVNYLGNEGDERVRDAFGGNHARLGRIKQAYDPANVFRLNQNIEPVTTVE